MTEARGDLAARVRRNLEVVFDRVVNGGGDPDRIRVVAVTKTFGPDAVRAAAAAGLTDVAENYAQELVATHDAAADVAVAWHFLGALQRNKLGALKDRVDLYQSLTTPEEARTLAHRTPGARCLLQIEVTGLPGRRGCRPADADALLVAARDAGLEVDGVMAVASPDRAAAAGQFAAVARLADRLSLKERSMGMSGDLEAAVACGSTMLRVGTALFGDRPRSAPAPVA